MVGGALGRLGQLVRLQVDLEVRGNYMAEELETPAHLRALALETDTEEVQRTGKHLYSRSASHCGCAVIVGSIAIVRELLSDMDRLAVYEIKCAMLS